MSDRKGIRSWWYGRKEDVMAPAGQAAGLDDPSGGLIVFGAVAPVVFEVKQHVPA